MVNSNEQVSYKRSRFFTRLPKQRLYTQSHFWISQVESDLWRVGLTKFAARMLGDIVELNFNVEEGNSIQVGQVIGSLEGFKAITELYNVVSGDFSSENLALHEDITLMDNDPYHKGWLYQVKGTPDPQALDVDGYVSWLDNTIDKMEEHKD